MEQGKRKRRKEGKEGKKERRKRRKEGKEGKKEKKERRDDWAINKWSYSYSWSFIRTSNGPLPERNILESLWRRVYSADFSSEIPLFYLFHLHFAEYFVCFR